jgi:hypothetical protein
MVDSLATCPNLLTYTLVTSDTLGELNKINDDFVYPSWLLYAQQCSIETSLRSGQAGAHHFHISCQLCLHPIEEVKISSDRDYSPVPDWASIVKDLGYTPDQDKGVSENS